MAIGGVVLGLGAGWLRDSSELVFRTTSQVTSQLQTECIAVLPKIAGRAAKQGAPRSDIELGATVNPRTIARQSSLLWSVVDSPFSRFTESMRSIKLTMDHLSRPIKVIGLTSTFPNDGKSTIAGSLAQLMSQTGARALLVDCDLRDPSLSRVLAPQSRAGLLDLVAGTASLADVICTESSTNLKFLPANMKSVLANTSEILASDAARGLFDRLREHFDYVVVDLSPLAPVVDARAAAHLVDSYLFVIEWGRTQVGAVELALNEARVVYENILGVVLNKADLCAMGRYEGCRGYYYNKGIRPVRLHSRQGTSWQKAFGMRWYFQQTAPFVVLATLVAGLYLFVTEWSEIATVGDLTLPITDALFGITIRWRD
jgi:succinoglycan biosynthesis transport protein ExoP